MSLRGKQNDNRGYMRGAGAYSKDYASFDRSLTEYSGKEIYSKIEGVGDYDGTFTGAIQGTGDRNRWPALKDRYRSESDGPYSKRGEGFGTRKDGARKQSDGKAVGGQKFSGGSDPFDY